MSTPVPEKFNDLFLTKYSLLEYDTVHAIAAKRSLDHENLSREQVIMMLLIHDQEKRSSLLDAEALVDPFNAKNDPQGALRRQKIADQCTFDIHQTREMTHVELLLEREDWGHWNGDAKHAGRTWNGIKAAIGTKSHAFVKQLFEVKKEKLQILKEQLGEERERRLKKARAKKAAEKKEKKKQTKGCAAKGAALKKGKGCTSAAGKCTPAIVKA
ncbi:hypothetical protein B0J14DRAFT_657688 [Halenospora varia]|nr:hypothetical protein B0J14DRAFT_657688 [Halenospora varia]